MRMRQYWLPTPNPANTEMRPDEHAHTFPKSVLTRNTLGDVLADQRSNIDSNHLTEYSVHPLVYHLACQESDY